MSRPVLAGPLVIYATAALVAGVFWPTVRELIGWDEREAGIGGLIVVTFAAVTWMQRFELAALPVRSAPWGLAAMGAAGLLWLAGELAFTRILTEVAVIAMVAAAVLTVFGYRWFLALLFPLSFLFLAVPALDPLRSMLAAVTADVAVAALRATGIPIYREGAYFSIPSGSWSVADECSGTAYLAVCIVLGVLYAWLTYRSTAKRLWFIGGAIVLGIAGNWVRVYVTVLVAHLSDNRLLRDDHYTFGWFLYAGFALAYGWLGLRYADAARGQHAATARAATGLRYRPAAATAVVALLLLLLWPALERASAGNSDAASAVIADVSPQNGWSRSAGTPAWKPELVNPAAQRIQAFEKEGRVVYLFTALFPRQSWDSKLVTSVHRLVGEHARDWTRAEVGTAETGMNGGPGRVKTGLILGREGRVLAWHWYWINGLATGSDLHAKWQQLLSRLQNKGDAGAWLAVYTSSSSGHAAGDHRLLRQFVHDMGPAIDRTLRSSLAQAR